jgi:hypothetical protein
MAGTTAPRHTGFWLRRLLAPSRLNRLLDIIEACPDPVLDILDFRGHELASRDLGTHVMECHRQLAAQEGPYQTAFQSIVDQLMGELAMVEQTDNPPTDEYMVDEGKREVRERVTRA